MSILCLNIRVIKIPMQSTYIQIKIQWKCLTAERLITVTQSTSPPQPRIKGDPSAITEQVPCAVSLRAFLRRYHLFVLNVSYFL